MCSILLRKIHMMIHAVDSLLEIHKKVGQLNYILKVAWKRRRDSVLGPNKWEDFKYKQMLR